MTLKKVTIGARVFLADNEERILLTRKEYDQARGRFDKELAKKITRSITRK